MGHSVIPASGERALATRRRWANLVFPLLAWVAIIATFIAKNRELLVRPILDGGDHASDSLRVDHLIAREFVVFEGHYGPSGTNHPGPFHLGVKAIGQLLLADTGFVASRHVAQSLAVTLFYSALFVLAATLAWRSHRKVAVGSLFLAFGGLHFWTNPATELFVPFWFEAYEPWRAASLVGVCAVVIAMSLSRHRPWVAPCSMFVAVILTQSHMTASSAGAVLIAASLATAVASVRSGVRHAKRYLVATFAVFVATAWPLIGRLIIEHDTIVRQFRVAREGSLTDPSGTLSVPEALTFYLVPGNRAAGAIVYFVALAIIAVLLVASLMPGPHKRLTGVLVTWGFRRAAVVSVISSLAVIPGALNVNLRSIGYIGVFIGVPALFTTATAIGIIGLLAFTSQSTQRLIERRDRLVAFVASTALAVLGLGMVLGSSTDFISLDQSTKKDLRPVLERQVLPAIGEKRPVHVWANSISLFEGSFIGAESVILALRDLGRPACMAVDPWLQYEVVDIVAPSTFCQDPRIDIVVSVEHPALGIELAREKFSEVISLEHPGDLVISLPSGERLEDALSVDWPGSPPPRRSGHLADGRLIRHDADRNWNPKN